jgi:hypothetical protein
MSCAVPDEGVAAVALNLCNQKFLLRQSRPFRNGLQAI